MDPSLRVGKSYIRIPITILAQGRFQGSPSSLPPDCLRVFRSSMFERRRNQRLTGTKARTVRFVRPKGRNRFWLGTVHIRCPLSIAPIRHLG